MMEAMKKPEKKEELLENESKKQYLN